MPYLKYIGFFSTRCLTALIMLTGVSTMARLVIQSGMFPAGSAHPSKTTCDDPLPAGVMTHDWR